MENTSETRCPICSHPVSRTREADSQPSQDTICQNEFYVHYQSRNGRHMLVKYVTPRVTPDEERFALR